MPELPEVETTLRGLLPHLEGQSVRSVIIRQPRLRWPIPAELPERLHGHILRGLTRRGKYLLLHFDHGSLLIHLGMSGHLRLLPRATPPAPHEHFDLVLENGTVLRLRDPRRFSAVLWQPGTMPHPLLAALGPEPLQADFSADYLYTRSRQRHTAIKPLLMDNRIVVGIGNIYANETLFRAGIRPQRAALTLRRAECERLVEAIHATLHEAIALGGSTLRDYVDSEGRQGYFQLQHWVYGRAGQPCRRCGSTIRHLRQGQRSSFYCAHCQK